MNLIHVKNNTYCIDTGLSYVPFYKINERDIILLDSGFSDAREILDSVLGENNYRVKGIICSHGHPDHVGNNRHLKEKYGCLIAMPTYEAHICSSAMNLKAYYNNITLTEIQNRYGFMLFETDVYITDEQSKINFCGVNFKLIHTPGHSPSHICIITPDDVCYLADALISYELIESAKIPFDFVLMEGLKSKDKLLSLDYDKYIVSHKGIYEDVTNLVADNVQFYIHRAERTLELIQGKMTMDEIMKVASKCFNIRVNNVYKYDVIFRMLRIYVDYLCETGKIKQVIEDGFLKYERV